MFESSAYIYSLISAFSGMLIGWILSRHFKRAPRILFFDKNSDLKLVIVVRTDLGMTKGKIAAQVNLFGFKDFYYNKCSHATLGCYKKGMKLKPDLIKAWEEQGQPKVVLKIDTESLLFELSKIAQANQLINCTIHDAGRTQIAAGSATCIGIGPANVKDIDRVTGHLKLL